MEEDTLYSFEETERDKASKQSKKHAGGKAQKSFEVGSFAPLLPLTPAALRRLAQQSYPSPVISVYLTLDSENTKRESKIYVSILNSLEHEEHKRKTNYIESLSHNQRETLKDDIEKIKSFIENDFDTSEIKSLVIFRSGENLARITTLPTSILSPNRFTIDTDPYTSPLVSFLHRQKSLLITIIGKDDAYFYAYEFGRLVELGKVKSYTQKDTVDVDQSGTIQQKRLEQLNKHLKKAGQIADELIKEYEFEGLITFGEEIVLKDLEKHLTDKIKKGIYVDIPFDVKLPLDKLIQKIEEVIKKISLENEEVSLAEINEAHGQGRTAVGIAEVLNAQNRFMVEKLFIAANYRVPGYICANEKEKEFSREKRPCSISSGESEPVDNLIDELIETAEAYHTPYSLFSVKPEYLDPYEHIAAIIREPIK